MKQSALRATQSLASVPGHTVSAVRVLDPRTDQEPFTRTTAAAGNESFIDATHGETMLSSLLLSISECSAVGVSRASSEGGECSTDSRSATSFLWPGPSVAGGQRRCCQLFGCELGSEAGRCRTRRESRTSRGAASSVPAESQDGVSKPGSTTRETGSPAQQVAATRALLQSLALGFGEWVSGGVGGIVRIPCRERAPTRGTRYPQQSPHRRHRIQAIGEYPR